MVPYVDMLVQVPKWKYFLSFFYYFPLASLDFPSHDVKTIMKFVFEQQLPPFMPPFSPLLHSLGVIVCLFADDNVLFFTDRCEDFSLSFIFHSSRSQRVHVQYIYIYFIRTAAWCCRLILYNEHPVCSVYLLWLNCPSACHTPVVFLEETVIKGTRWQFLYFFLLKESFSSC